MSLLSFLSKYGCENRGVLRKPRYTFQHMTCHLEGRRTGVTDHGAFSARSTIPFIHRMPSPRTCPRKSSTLSYDGVVKGFALNPRFRLGSVDLDTVEKVEIKITDQERARLERFNARPPLSEVLNLHDFEVHATRVTGVILFCLNIGYHRQLRNR